MPRFRLDKPKARPADGLTNEQRHARNSVLEKKWLEQAHLERFGLDKQKRIKKVKQATVAERERLDKDSRANLLKSVKKRERKEALLWKPGKEEIKQDSNLHKIMLKTLGFTARKH